MEKNPNNFEVVENIDIYGEANIGDTIRHVVASLPADVCEWVVGNITFIDMSGLNGVATSVNTAFPSETRRQGESIHPVRLLIVLSHPGDEIDDERLRYTVAHEIAHHWCGHDDTSSQEDYERQEQEADAQANGWGFPGKSNRVM